MRIVYKRSLTFIGFLIAICGFIGIAYLFYDKVISNETEVIVEGDLSINYITGMKIDEAGTYEFSITNNGSKDISFDIMAKDMKSYSSSLTYNLSSNEAGINITNAYFQDEQYIFMDNILIQSGITHNYILTIDDSEFTSFKLHVKIKSETEEYFFTTILNNNKVRNNPVTNVGEDIATTNEGLISDVDDYGTTYYFRGNVTNNYVSFANNLWRIVRINGDGTVKLVLNNVASELANYNKDSQDYENFEETDINALLLNYYNNYLEEFDSYIAKSKYCTEGLSYESYDSEKIYNPYSRLKINMIPTFNCLGEKYGEKISLLTADEVMYAGANFEDDNKDYYLYNEEIEDVWWTSTLAKANNTNFYPFSITKDGKISYSTAGTLYRYLRPTVNLVKKVMVTGTGKIDDPYVISE